MKNVTREQLNEAFEDVALSNHNSRKSIMFIKNRLGKKVEEALADIENIKNNGSRNHREFIYYSECTTFFDRFQKELLYFYREWCDDAFDRISQIVDLDCVSNDTIGRVLYGKDKSVLDYQSISSVIWQDYVDRVIFAVRLNLKK